MPSFDVVSEIDKHEMTNAVDQARRVVDTRFDFKGVAAEYEYAGESLVLSADADIQVRQMQEILEQAMIKRGLDMRSVEWAEPVASGQKMKMSGEIKEGISKDLGKKLVKIIKDSKLKVQASIQGEQVRVTGKKRDDLQQVMALLKGSDIEQPLQFNNFRD